MDEAWPLHTAGLTGGPELLWPGELMRHLGGPLILFKPSLHTHHITVQVEGGSNYLYYLSSLGVWYVYPSKYAYKGN